MLSTPFKHLLFYCMTIHHYLHFKMTLVYVCTHECYAHAWRSETTCRSGSSTTWPPEMELKLSGLVAGALPAVCSI